MNIHYKQSQFELFPGEVGGPKTTERFRFLFSSVTLPAENIVVLGIFIIMMVIFFFSLGVERGKKLSILEQNRMVKETVGALPVVQSGSPSSVATTNLKTPVSVGNSSFKGTDTKVIPIDPSVQEDALEDVPEIVRNFYTIQVASFKGPVYAQKEADSLKKMGHEAFILNKGKYVILCVGKFPEELKAKSILSQMKKKYKDCLIRRL